MALMIFGVLPIYDRRVAAVARICEQKGLVQTRQDLPRPPDQDHDPLFFAQLTRTGQAFMRPAKGGVQ